MRYIIRNFFGNSTSELEEKLNQTVNELKGKLVSFSPLPASVELPTNMDQFIPLNGIVFMAVIKVK